MSQTLCDAVAKVLQKCLQVQCWHEYGFLGDQFNERATFVSETFDPYLSLITSRNRDCERVLSVLGIHLENTGKCSN